MKYPAVKKENAAGKRKLPLAISAMGGAGTRINAYFLLFNKREGPLCSLFLIFL